jgi:phosphoglycolate phosphatase
LQALEGVGLGLVTGNIADGARLKLTSAGLYDPFVLGGYGSDSEEREHLPGVALDRAVRRFGVRLAPEAVTVIGDTPRDVACGLAHRLGTLAVATGRFGAGALRASGAHAVLDDLRDTDRVVELLTSGLA